MWRKPVGEGAKRVISIDGGLDSRTRGTTGEPSKAAGKFFSSSS
jgi:hypothetical protein